ncbi:SixA phosphatase family protein [Actinopolymorpha pittospori]
MGTVIRRLLLLRHGKADTPLGVADRDRPLAGRGHRQAEYAGAQVRAQGTMPDLAVVSPALRTRETWEAFAAALPTPPKLDIDQRLYANTIDDLLEVITGVPEDVGTLLVVGHNPSIGGLASTLDDDPPPSLHRALDDGYPTGTLAEFTLNVPWPDVEPGAGQLRAVIRRP